MENNIFELQYAIDTFYFLVMGALVMWMAAGFAMLESGLVRAKNTTEILTKNVALYAISCIMYLVCGYAIMYGGGFFLTGIEGGETLVEDALKASAENGFGGDSVYAGASDFFFQVVFVATAMSIVSGAVAERMKFSAYLAFITLWAILVYLPVCHWVWGSGGWLGGLGRRGRWRSRLWLSRFGRRWRSGRAAFQQLTDRFNPAVRIESQPCGKLV